jgi:hypothetical protein
LAVLAIAALSHSTAFAVDEALMSNKLDRCLKSINVIGASMGHVEKTGTDGKSMLHFVVRSNGAEYQVLCETETGIVKDVSASVRQDSETN